MDLAAPAVVACAVAGAALSLRRRSGVVAPLAAAYLVYFVYAAPTLLSGRATFAGYIKLDDTATYLAMLDRIIEHGRSIEGLPPSTHEATLATSLDYGYPVGSLVPVGVVHRLVGTDAAWLWQPHLAFLGALLVLALYTLASRLVEPRFLRAAIAVVAAQPALLYGYSLWGGVKELAAAALVATAAALVVPMSAGPRRSSLPLAVVCAALLGVLSIGGVVWVGPLVAGAAVIVVRERGVRFAMATAGIFAAAIVLCSIPAIVTAVEWLPRSRGFASEGELANLIRPLRWIQTFGIWPVGDFRREPGDTAPAYVLIAVTAVAALAGLVFAARHRRLELPLYAATVTMAALAVAIAPRGSRRRPSRQQISRRRGP